MLIIHSSFLQQSCIAHIGYEKEILLAGRRLINIYHIPNTIVAKIGGAWKEKSQILFISRRSDLV